MCLFVCHFCWSCCYFGNSCIGFLHSKSERCSLVINHIHSQYFSEHLILLPIRKKKEEEKTRTREAAVVTAASRQPGGDVAQCWSWSWWNEDEGTLLWVLKCSVTWTLHNHNRLKSSWFSLSQTRTHRKSGLLSRFSNHERLLQGPNFFPQWKRIPSSPNRIYLRNKMLDWSHGNIFDPESRQFDLDLPSCLQGSPRENPKTIYQWIVIMSHSILLLHSSLKNIYPT